MDLQGWSYNRMLNHFYVPKLSGLSNGSNPFKTTSEFGVRKYPIKGSHSRFACESRTILIHQNHSAEGEKNGVYKNLRSKRG